MVLSLGAEIKPRGCSGYGFCPSHTATPFTCLSESRVFFLAIWHLPVRHCELVLILMLQREFLYHPLHYRTFSPISCSFLLPSGQHHRVPKALREEKVHKILFSLPLSLSPTCLTFISLARGHSFLPTSRPLPWPRNPLTK